MKKEQILISKRELGTYYSVNSLLEMYPGFDLGMALINSDCPLNDAYVYDIAKDNIREWLYPRWDNTTSVIISRSGKNVSKQREDLLQKIEHENERRRTANVVEFGKELFTENVMLDKHTTAVIQEYRENVREIKITTEFHRGYYIMRVFGPKDWTIETVDEKLNERLAGTCRCPHCSKRFRIN
jgi:hypothetical protein